MIKQTLFFSTPVCLSLKNYQIVISWKDCDDKITRPIEDIGCVVLENQMINITLPLLNELVKNNVAVILCDNKMMPTSMLQNLDANTTQAESLKFQLAITDPMKKQVWKQIIESKIKNQAAVLALAGKNKDILKPYYNNVKSGDSDNREGLAAKIYWNSLLGNSFKREREGCSPNSLLNYGYSILRAAVARALLGSGLLPNLGIFHKSRYNAFPLADDVMEPYRPFVDEIVYRLYENGITELNKESKSEIMRVLNCDVNIGKVKRPLQIALTMTTASLVKYYTGEIKKLSLPLIT
uniref:type II CRISPR-associated endonuclease Cas1 n=1 Tax=Segatella hominis TaxID=2518605 RepID=UPI004026063A